MSVEVAQLLGAIVGLVLTILLYVMVMPKKKAGTIRNKFFLFLHDYFHFKKLYLEEVIKFLFTLATIACVSIGAFMLISVEEVWHYDYYNYYGDGYTTTRSLAGQGLLLMILGPIILRLVYEGIMLVILLVKNTMEINNKLKAPEEPAPRPDPTPFYQTNTQYPNYTQTQPTQQSQYSKPPVYRETTNPSVRDPFA